MLQEWASDHLKLVTAQVSAPSNRDFGSLTTDDVQKAKDCSLWSKRFKQTSRNPRASPAWFD